jgi:hypothetical protein
MIWSLIRSGGLLVRSDEPREAVLCRTAQTPPQAGARLAAARVYPARDLGRNLPALRAAKLPLRQWAWAWSEALPLHQPAWRAASPGLRAQRQASAGRGADRQLPKAARQARRDLCDQCRTAAPTRGAGVASYGPSSRSFRHYPARCHHRRHGDYLPRRRRSGPSGGDAK